MPDSFQRTRAENDVGTVAPSAGSKNGAGCNGHRPGVTTSSPPPLPPDEPSRPSKNRQPERDASKRRRSTPWLVSSDVPARCGRQVTGPTSADHDEFEVA